MKLQLGIATALTLASSASFAAPPATEPVYSGTRNVTETIVIKKPGTYDFKNVLHIWKGQNWNCGADKENGPQILRVEASNVTIRNFAYVGDGKTRGSKGLGDPIHIATCGKGQGNLCSGSVRNVVLDGIYGHACEDMITIGTPNSENITIQNSVLKANPNKKNWDKTIQVNFGREINIVNNRFVGGVRCVRFKPNTTGTVLDNVFENCSSPIRVTSNDADISPMKNGPSTVEVRRNKLVNSGALMKCNDQNWSGDGVHTCK